MRLSEHTSKGLTILALGLCLCAPVAAADCTGMTAFVVAAAAARERGVSQLQLIHVMRKNMPPSTWDAAAELITSIYLGDFSPTEARALAAHFCQK